MTYRLGIDVGAHTTAWATADRDGDQGARIDGGTVPSVVAVAGDGRLVGGDTVAGSPEGVLRHVTGEFANRLGDEAPVIVGGVPYGVEALIGHLVASLVTSLRARRGAPPATVAIAHPDGMDPYRRSLLVEACRLAGVPLTDILVVAHGDARAALGSSAVRVDPTLEVATGAALAEVVDDDAGAAAASTVGGIAALGAAGGGTAALAGGAVLASTVLRQARAAGVAGPVGTPLVPPAAGPAGTPLTPPTTGPVGTPLSSGPAGTPIGSGPTGTPLAAPATGPAGTPLEPGRSVGRRLPPRKVLVAIGAAVTLLVAAGAAVAVSRSGSDAAAPVTTVPRVVTTPATTPAPTAVPTSLGTTTVAAGTTVAATAGATTTAVTKVDVRCPIGSWITRSDSLAAFYSTVLGGTGAAVDVTGTVTDTLGADGSRTTTYDNWGFTVTIAGGLSGHVTFSGTDVGTAAFRPDGTLTFTDVSIGATVTVTVNGLTVPMPSVDRAKSAASGAGTFTCSGQEMTVSIDGSPTPFVMDRKA